MAEGRARPRGAGPAGARRARQDGFFTGTLIGKVLNDEIVEDAGVYEIDLDIGSATPASCEIIVDGFDLAAMLRAAADLTFKNVEPLQGKVEQRAIERTDAGVYGSSPYLAMGITVDSSRLASPCVRSRSPATRTATSAS